MYGEPTVAVTVKVPESKADDLRQKFYDLLKPYEVNQIKEVVIERVVERREVNGTGGFSEVDYDSTWKGKVFTREGIYRTRLQVDRDMVYYEFTNAEAMDKYINETKI